MAAYRPSSLIVMSGDSDWESGFVREERVKRNRPTETERGLMEKEN